jgi:hypothetical protein
MKANGTMTVRETATGETYELVDYVDDLLRERLSTMAKGSTVRLELAPIDGCERICVATRLLPGSPPSPGL